MLPIVPLPPEEEIQKQPGTVRVFVYDVLVVGNTVFSDAEIDEVTAPFKKRTLLTEDLERLRLALTLLYINKGYLTSGAIIPDQDVTFGVITVQIIEGKLTRVDVEGNRWFSSSYLSDRLELGIRTPVRLDPLQEQLQILQQDNRIERINAELRPGDKQGESVLNVRVADRQPFHAGIEVNNYQSPLVGEFRGIGTLTHDNLTGHGDPLSISYGQSSGAFPIVYGSYALPLNRYGTTFSPYFRRYDFKLIEEPFTPLDIKTNTEIIGMSLRQPIYKTVTDEVALSIIGEHLFTQSFHIQWHPRPDDIQCVPRISEWCGDRVCAPLRAGMDPSHRRYGAGLALAIQRGTERAGCDHQCEPRHTGRAILLLVGPVSGDQTIR